ncbi:MAG: hypothetical protein NT080_01915 [Spirochaetes bacterium]|nr:hypothetical protein [Spirochaetota bacterium]
MMQVSLSLAIRKDGTVSYGMPLWFRISSLAIMLVVAGTFVVNGSYGPVGVIVIAALAAGIAYEECWIVDPAARKVRHAAGFMPFPRRMDIGFDEVKRLKVDAVASGTAPGTESERAAMAEALNPAPGRFPPESGRKRRKVILKLLLETADGGEYLVDLAPASKLEAFRKTASVIAAAIGVPAE